MDNTALTISVIVPTFNGACKIAELLKSVMTQTTLPDELIVVIDGTKDDTFEVVSSFKKDFPNILIITQGNGGRSLAKNNGAKAANGDLLIFYDDDMTPSSNSIQSHLDFHKASLQTSLICGNPIDLERDRNTDIQNYKAYISSQWMQNYPDKINRIELSRIFFTTANCSIPKSIFSDLGGFDERLSDMEDYDLAFRALAKGINVYFDRANIAIHRDLITASSYVKRIRQYHLAKLKWKELHRSEIPIENEKFRWKRFFFFPFAFSFWLKAIDKNYFTFLPKKMRYRLYDIIIQANGIEFQTS